jgi:hypothetical protein
MIATSTHLSRGHTRRRVGWLALAFAIGGATGTGATAMAVDGDRGGSGSTAVASPSPSAALARYADEHGLTGMSPASLSPVGACRGLSLASATDCSDAELRELFCTGRRASEEVCGEPRP